MQRQYKTKEFLPITLKTKYLIILLQIFSHPIFPSRAQAPGNSEAFLTIFKYIFIFYLSSQFSIIEYTERFIISSFNRCTWTQHCTLYNGRELWNGRKSILSEQKYLWTWVFRVLPRNLYSCIPCKHTDRTELKKLWKTIFHAMSEKG